MPKYTNKCAICGTPIIKSHTLCARCQASNREAERQIEIERVRLIPELLWEKRRYEIAKDIFTGLLAHGDGDVRSFSHGNLQMTAADCVREANALIEELKKGGQG